MRSEQNIMFYYRECESIYKKIKNFLPEVMHDVGEEIEAELAEAAANELAEIKAEPIKPKAKGRPQGSLNKGPSKPRTKMKHK